MRQQWIRREWERIRGDPARGAALLLSLVTLLGSGWIASHSGMDSASMHTQALRTIPVAGSLEKLTDTLEALSENERAGLADRLADSLAREDAITTRDKLIKSNGEVLGYIEGTAPDAGTAGSDYFLASNSFRKDSTAVAEAVASITQEQGRALLAPPTHPDTALLALARSYRRTLRADMPAYVRQVQARGESATASNDTLLEALQNLGLRLSVLQQERDQNNEELTSRTRYAVDQRRRIHMLVSSRIQLHLADLINAVRTAGLWVFGAAFATLCIAVGAQWLVTRRQANSPGPTEAEANRAEWFQVQSIFGLSLLLLLMLPLVDEVEPEEIDLQRPFMPFSLRTWYLPAAASHVIGAGSTAPNIEQPTSPIPILRPVPVDAEALASSVSARVAMVVDSVVEERLDSFDTTTIQPIRDTTDRIARLQRGIAAEINNSLLASPVASPSGQTPSNGGTP